MYRPITDIGLNTLCSVVYEACATPHACSFPAMQLPFNRSIDEVMHAVS